MTKKRILHITSSLQMGGAEQLLFQQLRFLKDDFEHHVICFHKGPFLEKIKELNIPVYHVCYGSFFFIRFYRLVKKINPDVIHSLLWFANFCSRIIARLQGKPILCAIHSPCNTNSGMSFIRSWCDRLTMHWAAYVIVVADHLKDSPLYVPAHKIKQIDNGIDVRLLHERASQKKIEKKVKIVLGTVGRLVPIKNQEFLLRLLKELKNEFSSIQLVIVGSGPLRELLFKKAQELGLEHDVKIIADEATFYYPFFDLFFLPSHAEGLSMALLEAMSFGLPSFVASKASNHPVIIHNHNGYLFDVADFQSLIQMVKEVLRDEKKREEISSQAYKVVVERFSIDKMGNAYKDFYNKLGGFYGG